ncbi:hypothetical protein [Streptomyces sp. NPDC058299]|uniref:hypothetical protein n=1 Tax=unclassified Streptomyces TaxID=2593676 RepID=UPI0036F0136C
MKVRADVAELLRAGHSNRAIADQLHVDAKKTVAPARAALGLPKAKPGYKGAASAEDRFWRQVRRTDDGHMEWTGFSVGGAPTLRYGRKNHSAYRIAYRIVTGRDPEGNARPSCGRDHCVMPGHHSDRADRARAQARAAFIRLWLRGQNKAARTLEREREKAARAQEQRLDALYVGIFGEPG